MSSEKTSKLSSIKNKTSTPIDEAASLIDGSKEEKSSGRVATHHFKQFMGMMQVRSGEGSMLEKLDSNQISQVIENAEKGSVREHDLDQKRENSNRLYLFGGFFFILLVCWLFLHYQKTEHIDAIISAVVGLLGGYGFGRANAKD